jgi:hypothetical protein
MKEQIKEEEKIVKTEVQEQKKLGRRTPLHKQRAAGIKDRPGFIRRQVLEKPGRVEAFQEAGWKIVPNQNGEDLRDDRLQHTDPLGSVMRHRVNSNPTTTAQTAVWMEIEEEFYKEDMEYRSKLNDYRKAGWNPKNQQVEEKDQQYYSSDLRIE